MQDSEYLGDLGGLSAHRQLVLLDPRGTGAVGDTRGSQPPTAATGWSTTSRRCASILSLDQIDLLAHSAGANLALLYAARHPHRVGKLVLVTPSTFAVGISATGESRLETARLRA